MNKVVMFSSKSEEWETPQQFFDELNEEFSFTTDVCADEKNHKCNHYFDKEIDGLKMTWARNCWCNPPYGKKVGNWVKKASDETMRGVPLVVMLLPGRTDTRWFHDYIYKKENVEIRFLRGRLKFGNSKNSAPFPSMIVIFKKEVV